MLPICFLFDIVDMLQCKFVVVVKCVKLSFVQFHFC